jgi:hypothetical protein
MPYPKDYRYTKEHEWVKLEGTKARVGITITRNTSWATSSTSSCPRSAPPSNRCKSSPRSSRSRPSPHLRSRQRGDR